VPQYQPVDYDPFDQVSTAVNPETVANWLAAVKAYLGDVVSGKIAAEGTLGQNNYDPRRSFRENALNPAALEQATNIALGLSTGPLKNALGRATPLDNPLLGTEKGVSNTLMAPQEQLAQKLAQIEALQQPLSQESGRFFQRKAEEMAPPPIKAYHGSPYDFDAFDLSKIGTGEGAQAYGHGLYFAEHEPVAKQYRDELAGTWSLDGLPGSSLSGSTTFYNRSIPERRAIDVLSDHKGDSEAAIKYLNNKFINGDEDAGLAANAIQKWNDTGRLKSGSTGRMYEVNLHADPDTFLHWDKPLSEQPDNIKQFFANYGITQPTKAPEIKDPFVRRIVNDALKQTKDPTDPDLRLGDPDQVGLIVDNDFGLYQRAKQHAQRNGINVDEGDYASPGDYIEKLAKDHLDALRQMYDMTGQKAYQTLVGKLQGEYPGATKGYMPPEGFSAPAEASKLLSESGIPGIKYLDQGSRDAGEGTHNYVVFSPNLIEVVKKYGLAPLIAGGVMTLNDTEGQAQHLIPVDHDPFIEPQGGTYTPPVPQPRSAQSVVAPSTSDEDYIEPLPRQ